MGKILNYLEEKTPQPILSDWDSHNPQDILSRALSRWHPRIAVVTSFQMAGMVLLDMCYQIRTDVRVITIDTGRLPSETYEMMERVRRHYGIQIEVLFPEAKQVETLVRDHGVNLFYDSVEKRELCCDARKVQPLDRALEGLDAWIVGLRRDQSPSRKQIRRVQVDQRHGHITKLSPLADWTDQQVSNYVRRNQVPSHPLYEKGFTSIGCAPCTRAQQPGEDPRAGRWSWEQDSNRECGLHYAAPQAAGVQSYLSREGQ